MSHSLEKSYVRHSAVLTLIALIAVLLTACDAESVSDLTPDDTPFEDSWQFLEVMDDKPLGERGIGDSDRICQPVTDVTEYVDIVVDLLPAPELGVDAKIRFLVFEYDPGIADAPADCIDGGVFLLEETTVRWTAAVPVDRPELRYYVSPAVDVDGNGRLQDECVDYAIVDFNAIDPAAGPTEVVLEPLGCD